MTARILIIEDDVASRELFAYLLETAGYAVRCAANGAQGLAAAQALAASEQTPDLIVCDLQMPVLDGFAFLARMRAEPRLRAIPVVAVTAFSMPGDREKVIHAGFDGYLTKPVDPLTFVESIEAFLPAAARSPGPAPDAAGAA